MKTLFTGQIANIVINLIENIGIDIIWIHKTEWSIKKIWTIKNLFSSCKGGKRSFPVVSLTFLLVCSICFSSPFLSLDGLLPSFLLHFSFTWLHSSSRFSLFLLSFHLFSRISSALFIVWRPLRSPLMLFCAFAWALLRNFVLFALFLYDFNLHSNVEFAIRWKCENLFLSATYDTHYRFLFPDWFIVCSLIYLRFLFKSSIFVWNNIFKKLFTFLFTHAAKHYI